MAISANAVFEVHTGGNDTNGGGFVAGTGTDYSLVDGKRTGTDVTNISTTDAVANGTTTITSATGNFTSALVGNVIYLSGGTGSIAAIRKQVISVTNATTIVVDNGNIAASTGMTMNIGGALLSPAIAASVATVAGQIVYIKNGTYSITTASTNVAAGCISATSGVLWIGYGTNRTTSNTDTRPILQLSSVSSATIGINSFEAYNFEFDGASQTTSRYASSVNALFINCIMRNFTAANSGNAVRCYGTGCSATVFGSWSYACEATGNTATPFGGTVIRCLSYGNTGASTNGFNVGATAPAVLCSSYGNGQHGFSSSASGTLINCYSEGNTGKGFSGNNSILLNCGSYNNTGGRSSSIQSDIGAITLTGSAFTNAAGNDFTLNNNSGAGALLRAAGYPATLLNTGLADKIDVGALQHLEVSAGTFNPLIGMFS